MKTASELQAQWEAKELSSQQKYKDAAAELVQRLEDSGQRTIPLTLMIDPQTVVILRDHGYTIKEPKTDWDIRNGEELFSSGEISF